MITTIQMILAFMLGFGVNNDPFAYAPQADRLACEKQADAQDNTKFGGGSVDVAIVRYGKIEDCLAKRGHVKK